jgi:FeS assembly SUF system protein
MSMAATPEPNTDLEAKVAEAARVQDLQEQIVAAIKTCYDPEIPVNIYELGLIYGIDVGPTSDVLVRMTLTSPACPAAGSLPPEVEAKVKGVAGVASAKVEVVWEPTWDPSRMSEAARLELGMDDW